MTAQTVQRFQAKAKSTSALTAFDEKACPEWLSEGGKRIFHALLPELQQSGAKAIDIGLFIHLCTAFSMSEPAKEALKAEGLVVHNSHGFAVKVTTCWAAARSAASMSLGLPAGADMPSAFRPTRMAAPNSAPGLVPLVVARWEVTGGGDDALCRAVFADENDVGG